MRLCWKRWTKILLWCIELLLTPLLTAVYEVGNGGNRDLEALLQQCYIIERIGSYKTDIDALTSGVNPSEKNSKRFYINRTDDRGSDHWHPRSDCDTPVPELCG